MDDVWSYQQVSVSDDGDLFTRQGVQAHGSTIKGKQHFLMMGLSIAIGISIVAALGFFTQTEKLLKTTTMRQRCLGTVSCTSSNMSASCPRIAKDEGYEQKIRDAWAADATLRNVKPSCHTPLVYKDGFDQMYGRLVRPEEPNGHGVVIVHTDAGPHDIFLYWKAEALAAFGYIVLIADCFGDDAGHAWDWSWVEAARSRLVDRRIIRNRVRAAVQALADITNVNRSHIAAIGYCFGGQAVLDLARMGNESGVKAVVSFHGILDNGVIESADMSLQSGAARVLICHGDADPFSSAENRKACVKQLQESGAAWEMTLYGRVRHGFSNPAQVLNPNPGFVYDEWTAKRSWLSMLHLLEEAFVNS